MLDLKTLEWPTLYHALDAHGYALISSFLNQEECQSLIDGYGDSSLFRSTISMERYRFGKGEYKYFSYPLPPLVDDLRRSLYAPLAELANSWMNKLSMDITFPPEHHQLMKECVVHKQVRPTALILHYHQGGFNTLHQDLYGEIFFPFQVVFPLSDEGLDYEGGEFVLTEQLPRAQSRAHVLRPRRGDALIFTTNFRPVSGSRGYYRARMKHGVSELKDGERYALGIIFHDGI